MTAFMSFVLIIIMTIFTHLVRSIGPITGGSNITDAITSALAGNYHHIEAELKIKDANIIGKILKWAETQHKTHSETINHIWPSRVIKTIWNIPSKAPTWHTKERISTFDIVINGQYIKFALSAEDDIPEPTQQPLGQALIRKKVRDSIALNRHWQIDITYVNDSLTPEVEIEYIGRDIKQIPKRLKDINRFFHNIGE